MKLNINIEDNYLQDQIVHYLSQKKIEADELMVELLKHFFSKKESTLNFKTQNPDEHATSIDFGLESNGEYKLFQDVEDVSTYARELRQNAWK